MQNILSNYSRREQCKANCGELEMKIKKIRKNDKRDVTLANGKCRNENECFPGICTTVYDL